MQPTHIDYEQIAAAYARHRQVHPGVFQALCATVGPTSRVLEVGCGTGNYIIALHRQIGCPCWGRDPSAEMLAQARARAQAGPIDFRPGSAEQIAFPPGSFDLVFSVDVIHHIADRPAAYQQAYRVLDTGGRTCTATDSAWIIRHRQPLSTYFPETVDLELARYPRIAALRAMMAQAGFDEITEGTVEYSYALTDIQIYRDKAFSALHLISEESFQRGIARMERDLEAGPIVCTPRYTLLWGSKTSS
jgi:SAM-dependent methyltransferase